MQVLDEPADEHRALVVAQRDGVDCEPRELFDEGDEGLEVLFDREVEGVLAFDVYGDCGFGAFTISVLFCFCFPKGGSRTSQSFPYLFNSQQLPLLPILPHQPPCKYHRKDL